MLDAVFSLDAVIIAVGMVEHLPVMMAAVTSAITLMIFASKPPTRFVNAHRTRIILCLGFLLMIGFSLVAEGLGCPISKGMPNSPQWRARVRAGGCLLWLWRNSC